MNRAKKLVFALAVMPLYAGIAAAAPPERSQLHAPIRGGICLVSTPHCLNIAMQAARFCLTGAEKCDRDGTVQRIGTLKLRLVR